MGLTEKMWDGITTVIKMNDKVERQSATVKSQQDKIVDLTERLIRLEACIEIGLSGKTVTVNGSRAKAELGPGVRRDDGNFDTCAIGNRVAGVRRHFAIRRCRELDAVLFCAPLATGFGCDAGG
ncbi:MAG: hypothetical protein ACHP7D_03820 [Lysobacterales bacterium]